MSGRVCAACRRFRGAELLRARGYARGAERAKEAGGDKSYAMLLKALESKKAVDPERPSAEQQRADTERAKDYSRRRMAELRAVQADLSGRIRLRDAAIAALPQELQAAANRPDYTPMPARRALPMATPPVQGYYETKLQEAEEVVKSSSALGGGKRR